jgi:hypothetical protein
VPMAAGTDQDAVRRIEKAARHLSRFAYIRRYCVEILLSA